MCAVAIAKVQILCSIGQIGKSQRVNIFIYSRETSKVLQGHTFVNGLKKIVFGRQGSAFSALRYFFHNNLENEHFEWREIM